MRRRRNEYEQAADLSTVSSVGNSAFSIIRRPVTTNALNTENVVISGRSALKNNLLISLMGKYTAMPIIVVSDSLRSQLTSILRNTSSANFSFVKHNGESACYNFLRHKNVSEMMQFFIQIASEHGLFEQRRVESETLLQCILQLSTYSTNVFGAITNGTLTGEFLRNEINRQQRLTASERTNLMSTVNSSITAAQNV